MISYKKMSLFDAPKGSFLIHAANAEGIWGSGIAAEIKKRYSSQEAHYKKYASLLGSCVYQPHTKDDHVIVNLITSSLDSKSPDQEDLILLNTTLALNNFFQNYGIPDPVYCNKFNSGIFRVPWNKTELILKTLAERHYVDVIVCDPNLEE